MINNSYQKTDTGTIVCTDTDEFEKYKARRGAIQRQKSLEQMIREMQAQLTRLETKIDKLTIG